MTLNQSDPWHGDRKRDDVAADRPATAESRSIPMQGNQIDSRDIFQVAREIIIAHGGDTYRLRLTAQNKLILTK